MTSRLGMQISSEATAGIKENSVLKVLLQGFPSGSVVKNPPANAGDVGSIPREGNGNPLQYSCLGNPMDRGACP